MSRIARQYSQTGRCNCSIRIAGIARGQVADSQISSRVCLISQLLRFRADDPADHQVFSDGKVCNHALEVRLDRHAGTELRSKCNIRPRKVEGSEQLRANVFGRIRKRRRLCSVIIKRLPNLCTQRGQVGGNSGN